MKARSLLEHATFEPETLTAIFAAFDKAWLEIADRFPENADEMRTRLAHAMPGRDRGGGRHRGAHDRLAVMQIMIVTLVAAADSAWRTHR